MVITPLNNVQLENIPFNKSSKLTFWIIRITVHQNIYVYENALFAPHKRFTTLFHLRWGLRIIINMQMLGHQWIQHIYDSVTHHFKESPLTKAKLNYVPFQELVSFLPWTVTWCLVVPSRLPKKPPHYLTATITVEKHGTVKVK